MQSLWKKSLHAVRSAILLYGKPMFLFCSTLAMGALCFEIGYIVVESQKSKPIIIEPAPKPCDTDTIQQSVASQPSVVPQQTVSPQRSTCAFIGSKNSTKYHAPTCAVVKRIKEENKVCFVDEKDAEARGYQAGCKK